MSEIAEATTEEQVQAVRSLFREYQAEIPAQYCFASFEAEVSGLPGEYGPPKGKLLVATVAGQPVGCVGLRPFPQDGACEMKRLYVRPTFRSGKLGKALVDRVLQEARALGYSRLRLDTHPLTMHAAVQMYRKMGFREVPPAPLAGLEGLLYMELVLGPVHASSVDNASPTQAAGR